MSYTTCKTSFTSSRLLWISFFFNKCQSLKVSNEDEIFPRREMIRRQGVAHHLIARSLSSRRSVAHSASAGYCRCDVDNSIRRAPRTSRSVDILLLPSSPGASNSSHLYAEKIDYRREERDPSTPSGLLEPAQITSAGADDRSDSYVCLND